MCYTKYRQNITKESYRQQNPMKFAPSWGFLRYIANVEARLVAT